MAGTKCFSIFFQNGRSTWVYLCVLGRHPQRPAAAPPLAQNGCSVTARSRSSCTRWSSWRLSWRQSPGRPGRKGLILTCPTHPRSCVARGNVSPRRLFPMQQASRSQAKRQRQRSGWYRLPPPKWEVIAEQISPFRISAASQLLIPTGLGPNTLTVSHAIPGQFLGRKNLMGWGGWEPHGSR